MVATGPQRPRGRAPIYLLDTNILSEPLRPSPTMSVVEKLRQHKNELATAAPVWHELLFGLRRLPPSRRRTEIERYLYEVVQPALVILPYDYTAAEWHAAERARLTAAGSTPPFVDGQIAAIAQTNGLVLVTANVAHFEPFAGLQVETWRK